LTLLATPVAAQSTTEDGIRAMLRGDYVGAARILRPLADDMARPDPVAQYFLGFLYATGRGVGFDQARACGLFLKAAARPHPFSEQSAAIAASMQSEFGAGASLLCVGDERWEDEPPQAFVLGPGHRIVFADTSISLTHGDQERRTLHIKQPGAVFLPIQYTPLAVTRPVAARRDFFHWFEWRPDTTASPASWTLGWTLIEVVGDQWIARGEPNLLVVKGPTPPASSAAASLVRLRVNASGEAEFAIMGGPSPRTEVIAWQGKR
jgi:hypothetical protein